MIVYKENLVLVTSLSVIRQMSYVRNFQMVFNFLFMVISFGHQGAIKKKQSACKPGSVPQWPEVFVIYLSGASPRHFSGLPSDMERATLITSVYMTLQLLRCTARRVATRLVSSYLTFSPLPLPDGRGGSFLLHYSTLADSFLLGSRMLCVARTFLLRNASDKPADCFRLQK